jgi:hypothetical protein
MTGKDGKPVQVDIGTWQDGIERLRRGGQVENFNKAFGVNNGAKILAALPYQAPPAIAAAPPTVQPAAGPSFWTEFAHHYLGGDIRKKAEALKAAEAARGGPSKFVVPPSVSKVFGVHDVRKEAEALKAAEPAVEEAKK